MLKEYALMEVIMDETREIDIDLRKILYMMKSKVIFIVLATILVGSAAGIFTHYFIQPIYKATISMTVYNNPERVVVDSAISNMDVSAAKSLVGTYMFVLNSDPVMEKVAQELNIGSSSAIKGYVSTSAVDETFAFRVTVSCTDPKLASDIANAIAKYAPDEMQKVVKVGGVSVVEKAKQPRAPSSPNLKKNVLIGCAIGFFVSFIGFFVYEMFDSTITNARDLEREFNLPVLGTVPSLDKVEKKDDKKYGTPEQEQDDFSQLVPPDGGVGKPSSALLENLQAMKGDGKDD